ncbi:MAG: epoxyalkane--coenzyme M transferase [Rhodospirillales bacterium]
MKRSTDRIVTTHVGSLPRPQFLVDAMVAQEKGVALDAKAYEAALAGAVADVVKKQVDLGVDVVDDGEFSKPGFAVYVNQRLGGYTARQKPRGGRWAGSREAIAFPEFYGANEPHGAGAVPQVTELVCTGPVVYKGHDALKRDIANLKAAAQKAGAVEAFMPAISPVDVCGNQVNQHYKTERDFLFAIADAMNEEYRAIADAGIILQIDDPHLVTHWVKSPDTSLADYRKWAEGQVEAINHALRGVPEDRVRYHTCYGINMGPRVHEMGLESMLDIVLKVNAGAYSFEAANPRHEHEWRLWETTKLPDGKSIIPGTITHASVLVEHPELVAERILRFANLVGRENVIAGGDCGFGTQASATPEVHPTIVWAKFAALAEGARIATKKLWK